jgi:lipoprotein-anchoring transpeptidase ErfK/SrfK
VSSHQIQFLAGRCEPSAVASVAPRANLRLIAALATAALLGLAEPAAAYQIYWPNQTFEQADPLLAAPPPRKRPVRHSYPKLADAPKDTAKPHGPLIIAISIEKQHLKIYDANGLFAESSVSTGMRGHSTPMGVFSIIQKSKWHRSNLYSDAPMPYMQRITWSGVAMHAGVLPGYPASHGCIRMPMAFATKLWSWSKLGARVVIAPGDVMPADISHPALIAHVPAGPASASLPPDKPVDVAIGKSDKAAGTEMPAKLSPELAQMELRLTPKHDDLKAPSDPSAAESTPAGRVRLADAEGALASMAAEKAEASSEITSQAEAGTQSEISARVPPEATSSLQANASPENKPAPEAARAAEPSPSSQKTERADTPVADATEDKDQSRAADITKDAAPKNALSMTLEPKDPAPKDLTPVPATPKRTGHIAVLISRKESRLYVRQNFEPLFDMPVTIAQSDRPLGTHIFTARTDGTDPDTYRWSVVSLPTLPKRTDARAEDLGPRHKRSAPTTEITAPLPPITAMEALDRLTIPEEATTKIGAALAAGGSIIVSDQGLGGETGQGTDFIIPLR